jgi:uncharacterized membrane protein YjdF
MFKIVGILFMTLLFNMTSIVNNVMMLGLISIGPIMMFTYVSYLSNSTSNNFSLSQTKNKLIFVFVIVSILLSSSALGVYALNNPEMLGFS